MVNLRVVERRIAILVGLACAIVVAAYASERAADLALFRAAAPSSDGPGLAAELVAAARALAAAGTIGLACYGFGRLACGRLARAAGLESAEAETALFAVGTGIGSVAMFVLGLLGALTPPAAIALAITGLASLAVSLRRDGKSLARGAMAFLGGFASDRAGWAPAAATVALVVATVLIALGPPTAKDELVYHLALPKAYVSAGRLVDVPENVYSYLPLGSEMLFTWALLLGPDSGARCIHALGLVAVLTLVYGAALRLTSRHAWAAFAALVVASVPSVPLNAGIAHNEMPLCLAITLVALLVGRWYETGTQATLALAGLCYGIALSNKHTALVLVPFLVLVVLLRVARREPERHARAVAISAALLALGLVFAGPWYARNAILTGNPLFPFFWGLFPTHAPRWDAERTELFDTYLRTSFGIGHGPLALLRLPWEVSVRARIEEPRLFDGIVGPVFLLLAPAIAWRLRALAVSWRVAAATGAFFAVAWAMQSQQVRFLLPALPVSAVIGAGALAAMQPSVRTVLGVALGVVTAINCATIAAFAVAQTGARAALGLESRESFLARALPHARIYDAIDRALPADSRVMLVDTLNDTYYLSRPAYYDTVFEDYTVTRIALSSASADEVRSRIRALGVTHILARNDVLLGPASPFPDDASRGRWLEFLARHTRVLAADGPFVLYFVRP